MNAVKAFIAGFVSTLVFHQGLLAILYGLGRTPREPYVMTPTPPFGVPQVISLAFWGGLWGVLLWNVIRNQRGDPIGRARSCSAPSGRAWSRSSSSFR